VYHKHKINFGNAPLLTIKKLYAKTYRRIRGLINAPAIFLLNSFWSKIVLDKIKDLIQIVNLKKNWNPFFNFVEIFFLTKRNSKENAPAI
jgi:hypothetical protein